MAQESFNAVYIGSNDYWGYDADTFNEETNFFGKAWVVPANEATPELIGEEDLSRCQLYYEVGKTDNHLFTPDSILYDDDAQFLIIRGHQGRIGQPNVFVEKNRIYAVNEMAQRYKNMTDGPDSRAPGRFSINYIVADNEPDKNEIKEFMETLDEDPVEVIADAEAFGAENLNRINPVYVEGAEDVFGSETLNSSSALNFDMEDAIIPSTSQVDVEEANLVGVIGEGQDFGQYNAEQGYDDRDDDSLGMRHRGRHIQSLKSRRDESKGMEKAMGRRAYSDVGTMDAEFESPLADPEVFGPYVNDNVVGQDYAGQVIGQDAEFESPLADPEVFGPYVNDNVVGQDYAGQVIGQDAEDIAEVVLHAEDGALEVHTTNGGVFLADIDSGAIIQDTNSGFAAEDAQPLAAEDVGFLLSLAGEGEMYDYNPEDFEPGYNPESYTPPSDNYSAEPIVETIGGTPSSPMNGVTENYGQGVEVYMHNNAEDVVEAFQDLPIIKNFNLNGWAASAAVVGISLLTGSYLSRRA